MSDRGDGVGTLWPLHMMRFDGNRVGGVGSVTKSSERSMGDGALFFLDNEDLDYKFLEKESLESDEIVI